MSLLPLLSTLLKILTNAIRTEKEIKVYTNIHIQIIPHHSYRGLSFTLYDLLMCSMEISMNVPQKIKVSLSATPLLVIYLKESVLTYNGCASMLITALFTTAKLWNQPRCP
jgi:hypothetical protein